MIPTPRRWAFACLSLLLSFVPAVLGAQKALVYCPAVDPAGCGAIVGALGTAPALFPAGADAGYDGGGGTIDLATADLSSYAVLVIPSLADDGTVLPYAMLRDPAVAARIRAAFGGRVAVWSGTPDLGTSNRDKKDALLRNLAGWARAGEQAPGVVALLDASAAPYSWLSGISAMSLQANTAVSEIYANVEVRTSTGTQLLSYNGLQLGYTNMASGALIQGADAVVEATGGRTANAVLVTVAGASAGEGIATITTDKEDYAPGETVTITGTGWEPGETVSMRLHEEPVVHGDRTLSAVADSIGTIFNNAFKPEAHDLGVRFVLTAVGEVSGRTAQTTFTDAVGLQAVSIGLQSPTSTVPGGTATYVVSVQFNGNNGSCSVALSISTTLPAGTTYSFSPATVSATDGISVTSSLTLVTSSSTPTGTSSFAVRAAEQGSPCGGQGNAVRTATGSLAIAMAQAPTVDAAGPYSGIEGSSIGLTGATASGGATPLTYKWTYAAGAGVDAGATCSFSPSDAVLNPSITCTDDGPFTLTLTVTGSNSQSASDNASLTLSNAPPVAEAGGPYSGNEGTAITLAGSANDPGDNDDPALTYLWTADVSGLGGGTCAFDDASSKDAKVTCTDNGTATLTLTVSDGDGGSDTDTATLTIGNAAPVADAGGPYSGNEGSAIALNGSASDAGSGDTHTWSWAYVSGPGFDAGATCAFSSATLEDPTITCTDDGVVQLTLTVEDDDNATDSDEATLTIANVAPVANAGGSYSGDEGEAITLNGSATDAGTNDVLSYLWTADASGLGGGTCSFDDASKKDAKVTCTDNGTVTLTLTVTDDDGDADTDTATLTLANVGPVANAGLDYSGDEGSAIQLNGSVTDAGANDTHVWSWAYVAGAGFDAGGTCTFDDATAEDPEVTCTDDGTVELTLTVTDDDGESGTDTALLTLANVDPVADAGTSYNGVEGSAVALNGSVTDAGANDTHTWSWQYVGGAGVDAGATCQFSNAAAEDPTITCTDDGIVQLTLTVTDDDGGSDSDQATLTLTNAPPVAAAGGAYTGSEGSAIQLAGSATDPGTNDALTYAWTVDASGIDGGGTCTFDDASSKDAKVTCTDNGTATLTLTVKDDDGGEDTDTATLTVSNVDPVADARGPYTGAEGSSIALSGSGSDVGSNDVLSQAWTYAPGAGVDAGATCSITSPTALAASITCTDDGTYQVTLTVQDDDGGSHASNAVLTVSNAAPVLSAINAPLAPVNITTPVVVSATFTDAGANDTHTGLIDWGDGTSAASITEANGSGTASGSHIYGSPGVYTIRMTVTDDDGSASNESVYQYVVVFDPSAGFVTGGGWLNSTPGMYRVDAAAQGKANFGFVSKYQKGATVPSGNTEFQFHAGDLNFKSSVYQWLVVQGQTKASYKGSGTINGAGNFGFLLSVIDGGSTGDKFRIKIWDRDAADAVVYDNLLASAGDDALPTTSVLGGNIVVHAK